MGNEKLTKLKLNSGLPHLICIFLNVLMPCIFLYLKWDMKRDET